MNCWFVGNGLCTRCDEVSFSGMYMFGSDANNGYHDNSADGYHAIYIYKCNNTCHRDSAGGFRAADNQCTRTTVLVVVVVVR